ncbi:hypothetical protein J4E93_000006 [Alternaria ventricosa]|uniref:uncharacterized protein n=1 Tax=Alternaria ventricosa TaxID=1187951 RepID=UPI0020C4422C|nr:uncharacterized protein J4E93_000006 [Alternaria ventricosa]KAI4655296.1 hypothetical protein J4E93_000006 [Alternaria ventricosa]
MESSAPSFDQASAVKRLPGAVPRPPSESFRVVKTLSAPRSSAGVYLCLPRALPLPFEPSNKIDPDIDDDTIENHDAWKTLSGFARLQQQLPLLTYKNLADVLYKSMQENRTSSLSEQHLRMLPQLVVVKTRKDTDVLRNEATHFEEHRKRDKASLFIGSYVLRAEYTDSSPTAYNCLRPIFGPTLAQFGEANILNDQGGIPSWFVAHIILGLIDAVWFLHEEGLVHGKVEASNIMLNLYPTVHHHRYRGYPDILLIDFSATGPSNEDAVKRDESDMLKVIEQVITKWSDVAPFLDTEDVGDPLIVLLAAVEMTLSGHYDGYHEISDLRDGAEDIRHEGPHVLPRTLMKLLHADLATAAELDRAVQEPPVTEAAVDKEALEEISEDDSVTVGGSDYGGVNPESTGDKTRIIEDGDVKFGEDEEWARSG